MTVLQASSSNHSEIKLEFAGTGEVLTLVLIKDISGCPWAEIYNREVPTDQNPAGCWMRFSSPHVVLCPAALQGLLTGAQHSPNEAIQLLYQSWP